MQGTELIGGKGSPRLARLGPSLSQRKCAIDTKSCLLPKISDRKEPREVRPRGSSSWKEAYPCA